MDRHVRHGEQQLALDDDGSGEAVVGLHGLTATRRYVLMGARAVERAPRRVVLLDARGHGASAPAPGGDYSYAAMTGDLVAVLDALAIERAVIVGVSMGAHTAVRFALERPARVSGLLLVTPAYDPDRADADLSRWDALAAGLRDGGIDGFLAAFEVDRLPPAWRETAERGIRQRLAGHRHPQAVADALSAVPRSRPFASWEELAAIAVPVVVVGSRDAVDPQHPLAVARRYAETIPGARLVVEDEGRPPIAWQGGRLSRLVLESIREPPARSGGG